MRALIVYASPEGFSRRLAASVKEGCRKVGVEYSLLDLGERKRLKNFPFFGRMHHPEKLSVDLTRFGIVFLGFELGSFSQSRTVFDFIASNEWKGVPIAIYCSFESKKKGMEQAVERLEEKGARIVNTLSMRRHGLIRQKLDDTDLVRAEAFGERVLNIVLERRVFKHSKKASIQGYRK
ncbi:hypothetical protein KJ765_06290 [Candidatus Micrarchaeota archaeon]|nr:hypothetical protein [Candidatus Micrarchaeota archaeon]